MRGAAAALCNAHVARRSASQAKTPTTSSSRCASKPPARAAAVALRTDHDVDAAGAVVGAAVVGAAAVVVDGASPVAACRAQRGT